MLNIFKSLKLFKNYITRVNIRNLRVDIRRARERDEDEDKDPYPETEPQTE